MAILGGCLCLSAQAANLMVEVRIEGQATQNVQGAGAGFQGGSFGIQGGNRTVTRRESSTRQLLVMDGGTAMLSSVQTQPLRLRQVLIGPHGKVIAESYVFRSLGGGIRVRPQTRGEMVDIEVSAEEARPALNQPVATEVIQLSTLISGRIGEWILLGDDQRSGSDSGNGAGLDGVPGSSRGQWGQSSMDGSSGQKMWLRVQPQSF
jgi:hypothetical protein